MSPPQTALKYEAEVRDDGRLELSVPWPAGTRVVVFVIEEPENGHADLVAAAGSSLDFWDNAFDDEDWNDA